MNILYISGLCSPEKINNLYKTTGKNPGFAMQKFNRLIAEGFVENGCMVQTLSAPPISDKQKGFFYKWNSEYFGGIKYSYIPFINVKIFRQASLFLYTFIYVLIWRLRKKNTIIICDMLAVSINMATILASKINRLKCVGILTDMPGLMKFGKDNYSIKLKIATILNKIYLSSYDYYVFLTKQMNAPVNKKHKPFIIMEGLVDSSYKKEFTSAIRREKQILYAGGLFDEYGIRMLVKAFLRLESKDLKLQLFGDGPIVDWIKEQSLKDNRIIYQGIQPNGIVEKFERQSILLVNPRPTREEFTQYSFPSKNMEYMVSGTPVITTQLPGMPNEYKDYVYLFNNETVDGFEKTLRILLSKDEDELIEKGEKARNWVLKEKNNIRQSKRILDMVN